MPLRDNSPALPIHANGVELAQRYGHVPARAKGQPKPWHIALVIWWRFIRRREALTSRPDPAARSGDFDRKPRRSTKPIDPSEDLA